MTDKAIKPEDLLPDGDDYAVFKGVRVRKGSIAAAMRNMELMETGTPEERAAALAAIKELAPGLAVLGVHRNFQCRNPAVEAILADAAATYDSDDGTGDGPAAADVVRAFVEAFDRADEAAMNDLLAENLTSYITNADGGVNRLDGRDAFMASVNAMDIGSVNPDLTITQIAPVGPGQVMAMVEIKAERKGRTLHNHAAFLMTVRGGRIREMRMVEALPAYSDSFWKD